MTPEEVAAVPDELKMRAAFLLAADYPAALARLLKDNFEGQAELSRIIKEATSWQ